MAFADKIRISEDPKSKSILREFKADFKKKTGINYPESDLQWREVFAKAGFSPSESRGIRDSIPEVGDYYDGPGVLMTELVSRLVAKKKPGRPCSEEVAKRRKQVHALATKGLKPGEIAARLKVGVDIVKKDIARKS